MEPVTKADRERELHNLLEMMQAHPERDWSEAKARAEVLRETLKEHHPAQA